jgi:hypothetical protein
MQGYLAVGVHVLHVHLLVRFAKNPKVTVKMTCFVGGIGGSSVSSVLSCLSLLLCDSRATPRKFVAASCVWMISMHMGLL